MHIKQNENLIMPKIIRTLVRHYNNEVICRFTSAERHRLTNFAIIERHSADARFVSEEYGPDGFPLHPQRQKRIRTSFKHHQLRILKNYFGVNSNPDAKELKNLADKTCLPKRVLQVKQAAG